MTTAAEFGVRLCVCENGERLPLMVGVDSLPIARPNQYALFVLRPRLQASSLAEELATIASVYEWAHRCDIDIEDRFRSGNGLTSSEMPSLLDFLRLTRAFGRRVASHAMHIADPESIVSSGGHRNRILVARDFLVWGMDETLAELDVRDQKYRHVAERRDRMRHLGAHSRGCCRRGGTSVSPLSKSRRRRSERDHENRSKDSVRHRGSTWRSYLRILKRSSDQYRRVVAPSSGRSCQACPSVV